MEGSTALVVTLCMVLILTSSAKPTEVNDGLTKITTGSSAFGQRLFQQFENETNVVISPLSVYFGLALTWFGSKGETRQVLSKGLGLDANGGHEKGFSDMLSSISSSDEISVSVANKIYIEDKRTLVPAFNEYSQMVFNASAQNIDFNSASAADVINNWVSDATNNKITEITDRGGLKGVSVMLLNVLYFRGPWEDRFYLDSTLKPFHVNEGTTLETQFMSNREDYRYAFLPDLDAELIEIPYQGHEFSLCIVLPKKKNGLPDLEKKLALNSLQSLLSSPTVHYEEINLSLPKFKLEMTAQLVNQLTKMGFSNIFSGQADFTGMTAGNLRISEVLQKTYFEINELGTEAAAVTAIKIVPVSAIIRVKEPITVKCDRPFLFYLVQKRSLVLFAGKFVDPRIDKISI